MKECFCTVIHMEGRRSDPADKNSAIERLNQFYTLQQNIGAFYVVPVFYRHPRIWVSTPNNTNCCQR